MLTEDMLVDFEAKTRQRMESTGHVLEKRKEPQVQNIEMAGAVVAHAFDPSTREAEAADLCEFEASLVYKS